MPARDPIPVHPRDAASARLNARIAARRERAQREADRRRLWAGLRSALLVTVYGIIGVAGLVAIIIGIGAMFQ